MPRTTLRSIALLGLVLLLSACGGDDSLRLTFEGENCTYEGPTELKAGPVELVFFNESDGNAAPDLVRHIEDETIQDMIDYIGEEPAILPLWLPSWAEHVAWHTVYAGESWRWEGDLEPGIHSLVCSSISPNLVWFGTGLTVEG